MLSIRARYRSVLGDLDVARAIEDVDLIALNGRAEALGGEALLAVDGAMARVIQPQMGDPASDPKEDGCPGRPVERHAAGDARHSHGHGAARYWQVQLDVVGAAREIVACQLDRVSG